MINERLRKRLKKDRPTTTITMRIPVDVVESLKSYRSDAWLRRLSDAVEELYQRRASDVMKPSLISKTTRRLCRGV